MSMQKVRRPEIDIGTEFQARAPNKAKDVRGGGLAPGVCNDDRPLVPVSDLTERPFLDVHLVKLPPSPSWFSS